MRRLIVAPHCDDEVIGCGGLLAKYPVDSGVVVCAQPDRVRVREFTEAQNILGYDTAVFLELPDGRIGDDMAKLVCELDTVLDEYQPEELYLPFPSVHQDHIAAYEAGIRAARLSLNGNHHYPPNVLVYDVSAYDLTLYPSDLRWNVFESLSEEQVQRKSRALKAYASQTVDGPHPINGVVEGAHMLGASRRLEYAEQFALVREVRA
jgi:N-acetylglucosamine malate deacetylase 1